MYIFSSPRLKERRQGYDQLAELIKNKSKCFIIHYSCESFITNHGNTPRITSICIKGLSTGQTKSFSIHLQAQFDGLDFNNLSDKEYDNLEISMLNDFSDYIKKHPGFKWIHWHMRNSNYGFEAINNRIRILKGNNFEIDDDRKFDFPQILALLYTYKFESDKPKGKLLNLAEHNNLDARDALTGAEEAAAFDNKEYLKLHVSTLKKVDILDSIIQRTEADDLKVLSSKKMIYGLSFPGIVALIKQSPWLLLVATILGWILNIVLEPLVKEIFHILP
jgi:hypothetical protein